MLTCWNASVKHFLFPTFINVPSTKILKRPRLRQPNRLWPTCLRDFFYESLYNTLALGGQQKSQRAISWRMLLVSKASSMNS